MNEQQIQDIIWRKSYQLPEKPTGTKINIQFGKGIMKKVTRDFRGNILEVKFKRSGVKK